jgi:nucleoside-diphosphate-sugar epimerase
MRSDSKHVLVTGGAGYCGGLLIPALLAADYQVSVYDILYYGKDHLPLDHPKLSVFEGDLRDYGRVTEVLEGVDTVIHLACISNDASFELDPSLSKTVNLDAFEPLVMAAKARGVRRFIYASSSSVYGVSEARDVREEHPLVPLTQYNEYKGLCEPLLLKHTDENFSGVIFRPATVCGYSPRQRLDLSVNILTNHAINNRHISVWGGSQLRPNLHIQDYVDLCLLLVEAETSLIQNQIFNCGYQNMSIMEIAETVKETVEDYFPDLGPITIGVEPSNDLRSYHINSDKIKSHLGFSPKFSVKDAIKDLCRAFENDLLPNSFDDDKYFNVRTMKALGMGQK